MHDIIALRARLERIQPARVLVLTSTWECAERTDWLCMACTARSLSGRVGSGLASGSGMGSSLGFFAKCSSSSGASSPAGHTQALMAQRATVIMLAIQNAALRQSPKGALKQIRVFGCQHAAVCRNGSCIGGNGVVHTSLHPPPARYLAPWSMCWHQVLLPNMHPCVQLFAHFRAPSAMCRCAGGHDAELHTTTLT
jgi:hypothetical protein